MSIFQLAPGSFEDSIRAAQRRQAVLPAEFYGVLQGRARGNAFTVSRLAQLDQVQAIQDSLIEDLRNGGNFEAWRTRILAQPRFGHLSPAHLETIYRTNLRAHHAEGRAASILKHQDTHPFLMYSATLDTRVRPTHAALHGIILPVGHEFWKTHAPPLGMNCRCDLIALTKRQAERRIGAARDQGKVIDQPPPGNYADPGWDYDRLNGSPSEGVQRAVSRRMDRCTPTLYASGSAPHEVHCRSPELAQAMADVQARQARGVPLEDMVREVLGGRRYEEHAAMLRGVPGDRAALVALRAYTDEYYSPVNELLRYTAGVRSELSPEARIAGPLIHGIAVALREMPAASPHVARALSVKSLPRGFMDAHQRGNVVRFSGFTSTSVVGYHRESELMLWIEQISGRSIAHVSAHQIEHEVLLPAGGLFIVTDVQPGMIWLREITAEEIRGRSIHEFTLN